MRPELLSVGEGSTEAGPASPTSRIRAVATLVRLSVSFSSINSSRVPSLLFGMAQVAAACICCTGSLTVWLGARQGDWKTEPSVVSRDEMPAEHPCLVELLLPGQLNVLWQVPDSLVFCPLEDSCLQFGSPDAVSQLGSPK